jgi:hypothetical protein
MFEEIVLKLAFKNCSLSRNQFEALRFICDKGFISTSQIRNYKFDRNYFYRLVYNINKKMSHAGIDKKILCAREDGANSYRWVMDNVEI